MQLSWQQAIGINTTHLSEFSDALGRTSLVHSEIIADLTRLCTHAKNDGVAIAIVSAHRSFDRQLAIWNDKWQGYRPVYSRHGRPLNTSHLSDIEKYKAISLWSALPGLSRHHWGTDLDIFAAEAIHSGYEVALTPEEFNPGGPCENLEQWLQQNLLEYGFFRPYREYRHGVSQEPWHISHLNTASKIFEQFDFERCRNYIKSSEIQSSDFIESQFEHYCKQYFANICEVTQ